MVVDFAVFGIGVLALSILLICGCFYLVSDSRRASSLREQIKPVMLRTSAYAAIVAIALTGLTIGLASSSWADWCDGKCY